MENFIKVNMMVMLQYKQWKKKSIKNVHMNKGNVQKYKMKVKEYLIK